MPRMPSVPGGRPRRLYPPRPPVQPCGPPTQGLFDASEPLSTFNPRRLPPTTRLDSRHTERLECGLARVPAARRADEAVEATRSSIRATTSPCRGGSSYERAACGRALKPFDRVAGGARELAARPKAHAQLLAPRGGLLIGSQTSCPHCCVVRDELGFGACYVLGRPDIRCAARYGSCCVTWRGAGPSVRPFADVWRILPTKRLPRLRLRVTRRRGSKRTDCARGVSLRPMACAAPARISLA